MSIERAIEKAEARKLKLNNLFQLHDGSWQSNFRSTEGCLEFGRGSTAIEALEDGMTKTVARVQREHPRAVANDNVFE